MYRHLDRSFYHNTSCYIFDPISKQHSLHRRDDCIMWRYRIL